MSDSQLRVAKNQPPYLIRTTSFRTNMCRARQATIAEVSNAVSTTAAVIRIIRISRWKISEIATPINEATSSAASGLSNFLAIRRPLDVKAKRIVKGKAV